MTDSQLLSAIYKVSKEGTKVAMAELGLISPEVSKTEAIQIWGNSFKELLKRQRIQGKKGPGRTSKVKYRREDIVNALIGQSE